MIFGRKKQQTPETASPVSPESPDEVAPPVDDLDDAARWDAEFDRDEGPFDINEVDLSADEDEIKRLDLDTLVLTPFEGMTLQLQVDREREIVQSILVGDGQSALEVAVFAGPAKSSMAGEIRDEVLQVTQKQGGKAQVVRGPFGAEIRRALPVKDGEGKPAMHLSRTWLVPGPGWVLRGVLLGKATFEPDNDEAQTALTEFFSNVVVRRGTTPAAPGSLLPMRVPQQEV